MKYWGLVAALTVLLVAGCDASSGPDLSSCLANPDTAFRDAAKASYDRFSDSTTVHAGGSALGIARGSLHAYQEAQGEAEAEDNIPSVYAVFTCAGKMVCDPEAITLAIAATSAEGRVNSRPERIIFLLDGETRLTSDSVAYDRGTETFMREVLVEEWVAAYLPYDRFVKIACADTVEYQVGGLESRFETHQMKRLRQLLSVVENGVPFDSIAADDG